MIATTKWDGKPISKPGCYSGVSMSAYHSGRLCVGPSISSSGLRTIFKDSEADYWDKSPLNPNRATVSEPEHFILGRATHHLLLGEAGFSQEYVLRPEAVFSRKTGKDEPWNGNRTECREWLVAREKEGRTVLTAAQLECIRGMAVELGKQPLVRAGVLNGAIESTLAWQDPETGVWLLSRPDCVPSDGGDFVDLKTSDSVKYEDITYSVGEYSYIQQGALVADGYEAVFGRPIKSFSLYFVRSRRPHSCRMVELQAHDLELGRRMNRYSLRRFVRAFETGEWLGPGGLQEEVQRVEISERRREMIETKLRMEGI